MPTAQEGERLEQLCSLVFLGLWLQLSLMPVTADQLERNGLRGRQRPPGSEQLWLMPAETPRRAGEWLPLWLCARGHVFPVLALHSRPRLQNWACRVGWWLFR